MLLEFRRTFRATTASSPRIARYLFHQRYVLCSIVSVADVNTDPRTTSTFPREYLEKVQRVHQDGDFGSVGYRYPWKESETAKLVLRTHTTAVSASLLYHIAQSGFKPSKLFSIDRVFRNETVDATHLAEFHQIEGVVLDEKLTLGDLIGFMEVFFAKMGITNLRFKVSRSFALV